MSRYDVWITNDRIQKEWIKDNNPAVAGYLINFDAGREATPESQFLSNYGMDSDDVRIVTRSILATQRPEYPRLVDYDYTREVKYGPQGWIYPIGDDRMIEKINMYYDRSSESCKPSASALRRVIAWASEANLKPYTYAQVVARGLLKTELSTNSGLPFFTKRQSVISESIALASAEAISHKQYPAIIGARSIKNKQRLIFMAPFSQNLRELSYVYPVMDYLLIHSSEVDGWRGQPYVERAISDQFYKGKVTLLSTDFEAMDTSVGPAQIQVALSVLEAFFLPEYREDLRQVMLQSSTQPVLIGGLTQPGEANVSRNQKRYVYLTGTHGLFSGLGFTNLVETILQIIMDAEFSDIYSVLAAEINGDDGVKAIDGHKKFDRVADDFAQMAGRYGLRCNPEKQLVSYDELHYLQRVYSPETAQGSFVRGAYPLFLTMNSAKNPERLKNLTESENAVRLLMIFENLAGNPYKREGYKALVAGSPYIQQWIATGEGSEALTRGYSEMVNTDVGSNLTDKTGIEQLDVYKVLKNDTSILEDALHQFGRL